MRLVIALKVTSPRGIARSNKAAKLILHSWEELSQKCWHLLFQKISCIARGVTKGNGTEVSELFTIEAIIKSLANNFGLYKEGITRISFDKRFSKKRVVCSKAIILKLISNKDQISTTRNAQNTC